MKYINAFVASLFTLFILGCASTPLVTYNARVIPEPKIWDRGLGFSELTSGNLQINFAPLEVSSNVITLVVDVKNNSEQPALIESTNFYLISKGHNKKINADDPEVRLKEIKLSIAKYEESLKPNGLQLFSTTLNLVAATSELANSLSGTETEKQRADALARQERVEEQNRSEKENEKYVNGIIADLNIEKARLEEKFLRKTTLQKAQSVRGIVRFIAPITTVGEWTLANKQTPTSEAAVNAKLLVKESVQ